MEKDNVDTTCWKTGKPANHYCFEDIIWNFCQFALLSDILRCRYRSIPLYCANNSFKLCCKSKRSDLTLQKLAYFALEVILILSRIWRVHIVFYRCKFWQPQSFSFQSKLEKSWKTTGCIELDSFEHYNGFLTKKIQFAVVKLNSSPRICLDQNESN